VRPLRLQLAGLNSFKEMQEIDFSRLCQGNVFGIFGPTGSGKSTIIDAITLALYGTVERANRRTQGIVNQALAEASVLFEWQLGSDEQQKTYRVERKYITKDDSVNCRLARLSELQGEEAVVLADKASQVDQAVQEILGLSKDDFTRAVVLPQGRFAEFLTLQGTERRRMLERIFGLEQFGEQLHRLTGERLRAAEASLGNTIHSQEMLGAAKEQDVKAAELNVGECTAHLADCRQVAAEAKAKQERFGRVREKQQELCRVEESLHQLHQQDAAIHSLEQKLERHEAAQRVAAALQAADAAELREQQAKVALERLSAEVSELEEQESQARSMLVAAQTAKVQQEEPLLQRLEQLKQALKLERQVDTLRPQLSKWQQVELQLSQQLRQQQATLQADRLAATDLSQQLEQIQSERSKNQVDPEQRQQLSTALATRDRLRAASSLLQEVESEVAERRQQLDAARSQLAALAQEQTQHQQQQQQRQQAIVQLAEQETAPVDSQQIEEAQGYLSIAQQLTYEQQQLERQQDETSRLDQSIQHQQAGIQSSQQQLAEAAAALRETTAEVISREQALERLRDEDRAALLAQQLQPGQPCPVCGSLSHPHPSMPQDSQLLVHAQEQLQLARQQLQSAQEQLSHLRATLAQQEAELARQQISWEAAVSEQQTMASKIEQQLGRLPEAWVDSGDCISVTALAQAHWRRLSQQLAERSQWQQAWDEGNRLLQQCSRLVENTKQQIQLQEQTVESQERELARQASKGYQLGQQVAALQQELAAQVAALGEADLDIVEQRHRAMDRQLMLLDRQLRQRQAEQTALEDRLRRAEQLEGELKQQHVQVTTECRLEQAKLEQLEAELLGLTNGAPAADLLRSAEQTLATLRHKAGAAQTALEQIQGQAAAARQQFTAAQEAYRLASVGLSEAAAGLASALQREQFITRGEAELALDWADLVPEWKRQIEQHRQAASNLRNRRLQLIKELDGQSISEEMWQQLVREAEHAAAAQEQAVVALTKAETALADVQQRHLQWLALEQQRVPLAQQRDLLAELSSLLRGNALVEFMAGEHLDAIAGIATDWLGVLTGRRYALEVAPDGGFMVRDDGNGGERRPVHTLSGGETFITSLALALALSSQVQLRGKYRLEFFFLDEGFGSLDPNLLEVVMGCLERMQGQQMSIGIISHVPELRERILRQVLVTPAEQGGRGSRVQVCLG
jgi:exonuclease SbcC